jgi:TolB protein
MIKRFQLCFLCILFIVFVYSSRAVAQYDYIDITNPFLCKIPVAIPVSNAIKGTEQEFEIARKSSDLLSELLDFTGYFQILDRESFLVDHRISGPVALNINFNNWITVGAELLIKGGVEINDDALKMELRLFDTVKQKMIVGKRYKGRINDLRNIMIRFADEIIFHLTGKRGIFTTRIAFISTGTGNKEIYICDFDGKNAERFTHHQTISLFPSWSWDAQWIAYTSYAKGKPDLYIRNINQNNSTIVSKKGINTAPAWIPGSLQLGATLSFSGDQEIYLLTEKGHIIKQLTQNDGIDISPSWAPDGKKFAFVSNRSGSPQIYIQQMDSGKVRRLTYEGNYNTQPAWSPTENKIAYTAMHGGEINIVVMTVDGSGPVQLTYNSGDNESPSWSPDGSLIVFSSTREGPSRLYVMTAFGTDQRRLLTLPGEQFQPEWSPGIEH